MLSGILAVVLGLSLYWQPEPAAAAPSDQQRVLVILPGDGVVTVRAGDTEIVGVKVTVDHERHQVFAEGGVGRPARLTQVVNPKTKRGKIEHAGQKITFNLDNGKFTIAGR